MEQRQPFSEHLKQRRLAAGLTHEALAERAALSARAISDLERGVSRRPRRETIDLLAQALALTPAERVDFESAARSVGGAAPDAPHSRRGPGSLPMHITSFVGRADELRLAHDLLHRPGVRLVTLTGPGGTGKSRLAAQVASELATEQQAAMAMCYVELAPVAATDEVVPAIAQALGAARPDGSASLVDVVDTVGDRDLLLVVDNFEHLLDSAPIVSKLLRSCPRLVVLATSRAALQLSGEHELAVPPLAIPPHDLPLGTAVIAQYASVRLFVDRAGYVDPGFALNADNAPAIAGICARLDGLPLALELAAARTKMLPPDALLERLDGVASGSALRLLTRGMRDVPPHQRTLLATMRWSYNLLSPAEQRLLRRLAIFAGGCTLAAAEAVCGDTSQSSVFELLGSLLDNSLLYVTEGPDGDQRYLLLETVREFGLEQLRASGELESVALAHGQYYLELAKAFGAILFADDTKSRRSVAEYHNIHEALRWLLHQG